MVADSYFDKNFSEHGGLDYRSHDIDRSPRFARECENVDNLANNSLTTRRGTHGLAQLDVGGGGLVGFSYRLDGTRYEELLTIDHDLWRRKSGSFTITYSGSATNIVLQVLPFEVSGVQTFYAKLLEDSVETYSLDLGNGIDEASPVALSTLISGIDGLTDYACSLTTGIATFPAAFIGPLQEAVGASVVIPTNYFEQVFCPTATPFSDFAANFGTDDFELADLQPHANRLFIATGLNELYKYDSVAVFRAGMPTSDALAKGSASGGALSGDYYWQITYEQTDALDNYVEGDLSNEVTASLSTQQQALTIPQIQPTSEFLTSCTQVAGAQTDTNIQVDDSSDFREGMTVALFNRTVGTQFVELRKIVDVPDGTHITLDDTVHVHDNDVISAGLVVNLWRNKAGGAYKYLVQSWPNDSASATVSFTDNVADASLGAEYILPYEGHGLPPANLRYLTVYQELLIGSDGSDSVKFSDPEGPEYWNLDFTVRSKTNDPIRGIGANREMLLVQKMTESHVIVGDLPGGNYRQERVTDAVGTDSHHSIVDAGGVLLSYSRNHGYQAFSGIAQPKDASYRITPLLSRDPVSSYAAYTHKRAVAQYIPRFERVLLFVPMEDSNFLANREMSLTFAVDVSGIQSDEPIYDTEGRVIQAIPRVKWWRWSGLDMSGGAAIYDDLVYFGMRHTNSATSNAEYPTVRYLENFDAYDYHDFGKEFPWIYEAGWAHWSQPNLMKKFNRAAIYSFPLFAAAAFDVLCELEAGFFNGGVRSSKTIRFGAGSSGRGWGYLNWGTDPWGDLGTVLEYFPFRPIISPAVKLRFSSTVWLTCPLISAWTIETVPVFKSAMKEKI